MRDAHDLMRHTHDLMRHALDLMHHALDLMRHAHDLMRHALDLMRHALDLMHHALDLMRHAHDLMRHAFDLMRHLPDLMDHVLSPERLVFGRPTLVPRTAFGTNRSCAMKARTNLLQASFVYFLNYCSNRTEAKLPKDIGRLALALHFSLDVLNAPSDLDLKACLQPR